MDCVSPIRIKKNLPAAQYPDGLVVPCGKCIGCRISKAREHSMRILHELTAHEKAVFVTLTYEDDQLPDNLSLRKSDLQKFIKRVRKTLEHQKRKIRYYACGEYGDQYQRPHYHLIVFGLGLEKEDKEIVKKCWPFCDWSQPSIAKKSFGLVEPKSIAYVARYIEKKLTGDYAESEYTARGREPVFKVSSLGMGRDYLSKNALKLTQNMCDTVMGVRHSLPRYYLDKLDIDRDKLKQFALDKECELVEKVTGIYTTLDGAYKELSYDENKMIIDLTNDVRLAREKNLIARTKLNNRS